MKYFEQLIWLDCQAIGCAAGTAADVRHVANMSASGGWYCPEHEGGRS